jgi:hypothetical protein
VSYRRSCLRSNSSLVCLWYCRCSGGRVNGRGRSSRHAASCLNRSLRGNSSLGHRWYCCRNSGFRGSCRHRRSRDTAGCRSRWLRRSRCLLRLSSCIFLEHLWCRISPERLRYRIGYGRHSGAFAVSRGCKTSNRRPFSSSPIGSSSRSRGVGHRRRA